MKKLISITLCLCVLFCYTNCGAQEQTQQTNRLSQEFTKTPAEFVSGIVVGWNIGNTFEATYPWGWKKDRLPTAYEEETGWGNPYTTKEMIDFVAKSGFNAVRIPISWYLQTTVKDGVYTINSDWMNRIKTIADYCLANNMYTIVDMHHDDKDWLDISATGEKWTAILDEYKQIWTQIATVFKDYGEKLILESNNEIVNGGDWWGQDSDFAKINELYKVFVDTVRATGGKNDKRYLMLPTYGAQWYVHQLEGIEVPNDDEHCIIDVHWYTDSYSDTNKMKTNFRNIKNLVETKGVPVVLGECAIRKSYDESSKKTWAKNYIGLAYQYGLKCFLWDDGGDYQLLQRKATPLSWNAPDYVKAILSNAGYVMYGDVNNDGYVKNTDINYLRKYLVKYGSDYSSPSTVNSDVNKDGAIDIKDLLILKKYMAKIINFLPVA